MKKISKKRKPNGYWTFERCLGAAKKCFYKKQFEETCCSAYNKARLKGWLAECCKHMSSLKNPFNYYTKELCVKEALKYKSKTEFKVKSSGIHRVATKKMLFKRLL